MVNITLVSAVWIAFNAIGLAYALRVWYRSRSQWGEVRNYTGEDAEAIQYQAKVNRRVAIGLSVMMALYLAVGLFSLIPPSIDEWYRLAIQIAILAGDFVTVLVIKQIDSGQTRLRAIIGGRRASDRNGGDWINLQGSRAGDGSIKRT